MATRDHIKEVITSEPILNKLVTLIADAIMDRVSQNIYQALNHDIAAKENEVFALKKKVKDLEKSLAGVRNIQEEQEQYSRRKSLRIYGIPEKQNEKTDELVRGVVKEHLDIELGLSDISRSDRITTKSRPGARSTEGPKPLIVKFSTYNTKRAVFDAKARLRGTRIFIQEDLTQHRRELINAAKQKSTVKRVWTNDGKITALLSLPGSHDRKITIRNSRDIERLE
ncbi:uncharacterized protein [Diadema setosum]|uniref:uncharacterized protein n=1 Tax=Diadema setosum TaxID=31175 RepID=UPI003B3A0FA0